MADTTLADRAEIQRISLMLGLSDTEEVVAWADKEIEAAEILADPLIELSLGRTKSRAELLSLLSSLATGTAGLEPLKHVLRIVAGRVRQQAMDAGIAVGSLHDLLKNDRRDEHFYLAISTLKNDSGAPNLRERLLKELDAFTA